MSTVCEEKKLYKSIIKPAEIKKYMAGGSDFIDDELILSLLEKGRNPDRKFIEAAIQKALAIETLLPEETAALLNVKDENLWSEIFKAAAKIKNTVYDNRVVTFAPLYCSNLCINNCKYCGFRSENGVIKRMMLSMDEIKNEAAVIAGILGHKRIVAVFGESPLTGADYIAETMRAVYGVKVKVRKGFGEIRRVNVNAAPMSLQDLKKVKDAGIGTFQVFQETYNRGMYAELHPAGTVKSNFDWRLYSLHRAMEAGIDDVAIGVLFGLYDWKYEVMGMLFHARDLEKQFGIGPHTMSVPRLEPAVNTPFAQKSKYMVSDDDFKKIIAVLRLSIPYAGLIVTCRERPEIIRDVIPMCTQRDASSKIGIGAYGESVKNQQEKKQQFMLSDTRSLDEVIRELASMGYITSFCTAGYRCGRTGKKIMTLLKTGREGCFCKLNAILTFQEWLEDFASHETKIIGERIINKEIDEVKAKTPSVFTEELFKKLISDRKRIIDGERDIWF